MHQSNQPETVILLNSLAGTSGRIAGRLRKLLESEAFKGAHQDRIAVKSLTPGEIGIYLDGLSGNGSVKRVIAAGGDGTINLVAGRLIQQGNIPLGIIPAGTFNHFARDNRIPLNPEAALENALTGRIRKIDAATVNGHVFLNNSTVGFYPQSVRLRNYLQRRGYHKLTAMTMAAVKMMQRFPLLELRISGTDTHRRIVAPFLFVGNNRYELDLFNFGARQRLDGGHISVYYPRVRNRLSLFRLLMQTALGTLRVDRDFARLDTVEITVNSPRKKLRVSLDGETRLLTPPLKYAVRPAVLSLIVPENQEKE